MKQKLPWILVAVVLLFGVVALLWPTKPGVRPRLEMSFLCFTNSAGNPEAVFAVHYPKGYGGGGWKHMEVDQWVDEGWKPWKSDGLRPQGMRLHGSSLQGTVASNGRRIDINASYLLPNTNDPWRIRTLVEEMPPLSMLERLPFLGKNSRPPSSFPTNPANLFVYWMTNEVGLVPNAQ
jgi:hypothetical protein